MKPKVNIFLVVTFALILSACGSSPTPEASLTEDASLVEATLPAVTPTSLLEILPTPASITSFDERVLATIQILKEPDEMVLVQGYIWTKTADGHVMQIDPATNAVIADVKVDTATVPHHYCQGLGTDGEDIWVCSASSEADNTIIDVVRVDPVSQSIVETFKVGKIFEQLDFPFLLNQIWVLVDGGGRLIGIDVTTNRVSSTIDLGARCFQLAAVGAVLMATCPLDDLVIRIDPERGEVTAQVTLQRPGYLAGNEDGIWVAQASSIVRLDPATLNPVALFTNLPEMDSGDIFIMKEAVWVRHEGGFLYRIDPTTNQFVEQIQFGQNLAGGSVLVTSDSIWATAYDDNLLIRLRLK